MSKIHLFTASNGTKVIPILLEEANLSSENLSYAKRKGIAFFKGFMDEQPYVFTGEKIIPLPETYDEYVSYFTKIV